MSGLMTEKDFEEALERALCPGCGQTTRAADGSCWVCEL